MKYKAVFGGMYCEFDSTNLQTAIEHTEKLTFHKSYEIFVKAGPYNQTWVSLYNKGIKPKIDTIREKHIAEFWKSFYSSIQKAGGIIGKFGPETTLLEVAEVLAQNNIRFHYEKDSIS